MNHLQRLIAIAEKKVHAPIIRQVDGAWCCSFLARCPNGAMHPFLTKGFRTQMEAYEAARLYWRDSEAVYERLRTSQRKWTLA